MRRLVVAVLIMTAAFNARADQGINQKKGFNAENVYHTHDIDAINAFNGNLTVTIPIGLRYPLADGFNYGLTAVSNSNLWEAENLYDPPDTEPNPVGSQAEGLCKSEDGVLFAHPSRRSNAGLGWIVTLGRLFPPYLFPEERISEWTYESPDGGDHKFGEGTNGTITADGSRLRMRVVGTTQRQIEFPDGTIHTFEQKMEGVWMPTRIENRFGAYLDIAYATVGSEFHWLLSDSAGRNHRVAFLKKRWEGYGRYLVDHIELDAFDGTKATYSFHYTEDAIGRPDWAERCPGYFINPTIQVLDRIDFPDDPSTVSEGSTKYSFQYRRPNEWLGPTGLLTEATLPTGARIGWEYGQYAQARHDVGAASPWIDMSWGVQKRVLKPASGTTSTDPTWTYAYLLNADYDPATEHDNDDYVRQGRSVVVDAEGNQTLSFFSAYVCAGTLCTNPTVPYFWSEYGKPFTREYSDGGMFLSEVQYPPGVEIDVEDPLEGAIRAKYVQYESDDVPRQSPPEEENWRLKSMRVKHFDPDTGAVTESTDTVNSNWDGFGHYRVTEVSGSTTTKKKKTTTNYNSGVTSIPIGKPWILNTYDYVQSEYDGQVAKTELCYDKSDILYPTTGFITRRRTHRKLSPDAPRKDLLAVYTSSAHGNVATEKYYGGDFDELPAAPWDTCTGSLGAAPFTLTHSYSNGVRSQSQYSGVTFKSLDLTIDKTGLVQSSRDTAGVETQYGFDPAGQLREVIPDGEAWTEYSYNVNPAGSPFGTVTVKQWLSGNTDPQSGDVPLTESNNYYDAYGRLVQQATSLGSLGAGANGATRWTVSTTTYDKLGRKSTVSVPVMRSSGASASFAASVTQFTYDALGRTKQVKQPDDSVIDTIYPRPSRLVRTQVVNEDPDAITVATTEDYDPFGRLVSVTENSGDSPSYTTEYAYDGGDRLVHVKQGVQNRYFHFDGAGLLTSEAHPESGTTSYLYNARGLVKQVTTPIATIVNAYDPAERLTSVTHNGSTLKSFTYDTASMGAGKVATATRVNDHGAVGTYTVKETFSYAPTTGRVQSKTTEVVKVRNGVTETTSFQDGYTYDELGANTFVTYPRCTAGCGSLPALNRVVENQYSQGLLKNVPGYTGDFTYHANGLIAEFRRVNVGVGNGPLYKQEIAADGMARPSAITVTGQCTGLTINNPVAAKAVNQYDPAGLTITASGHTSVQWYEAGSSAVIATGTQLNVSVARTTTYYARASNGTCSIDSTETVVSVNVTLPTVTTGSATSITQTGVTLNATVNPSGSSTTTAFEYGTTTAYGSSIAAQTLSGSSTQSISASVTGLVCGTTYHFRATAANPGGPRLGADGTFVTSNCTATPAPSITTNVVTNITETDAMLNATVNPNGVQTYIVFEYGPTTAYGSSTPYGSQIRYGTTNQTVANVVELACGTSYHVRAKATSVGGTSYGVDKSFSTAACTSSCTPEPIAFSTPVTRTLSTSSCPDGEGGIGYYAGIFSFNGSAGEVVMIDMISSDLHPYLYLVAPNGTVVTQSDYVPSEMDAHLAFTLTSTGTWRVHATTANEWETGTYQLTLRKCASEAITSPASLTRSFTTANCISPIRRYYGYSHYAQSFTFTGIAGKAAVIEMTSNEVDPYLVLIAPNGTEVAWNDDFNGLDSRITHSMQTGGTWTVHATAYGPYDVGTYQLTVNQMDCQTPDSTISTAASICAGGTSTATAPQAAFYSWAIENGTFTSSSNQRTVTFSPTGSQSVILTLEVTATCGATATGVATVPIASPTATVSGNHEIPYGGSQEIVAHLTGTPPWNLVWTPGMVAQQVTSSPARLTVQPTQTAIYEIVQIVDGSGCSGVASGEAVVTVLPPAPTQMTATATSGTTVHVAWSTGGGSPDRYAVDRCAAACSSQASWVELGTSTTLSYVDSSATASTAYLYRVRAIRNWTSSVSNPIDVATTIVLGNDVVAGTVVEDEQIGMMRTAVQAIAVLAGTTPPTFTGSNLTYAVVLGVHLAELRSALTTARASLGLPAVVYSGSTSSIRAADVNELRGGVR